MAELVLEFSNVSEAKVGVEHRIAKIKEHLDLRLDQILRSFDEIESKEVNVSERADANELEQLKAYRNTTISIFGPDAPSIETIDHKIADIEAQLLAEAKEKSIKLKWDDTQLLVLISELGTAELESTTESTATALDTDRTTCKNVCYDNIILPQQFESASQAGKIQNILTPSKPPRTKNSFGDVVSTKPPLFKKPLNIRSSQPDGNLRKSQSVDAYPEANPSTEALRFMSEDPNLTQPDETTLAISRTHSDPKLTSTAETEPYYVDTDGPEAYEEYTDMNKPRESSPLMCPELSQLSPRSSLSLPPIPQTPPTPSFQSAFSLSNSEMLDPSEKPIPYEPSHNYEEIDLEDLIPEKIQKKQFPRFPTLSRCPEGAGKCQIMKPKAVCVSRTNGTLFVAEKGNSRVQVFSPSGEHLSFFVDKPGSNRMNNPYGICIANNYVYVTQSSSHCVHYYTLTGAFVKKFGKEGTSAGKFKLPSNITANPSKKQLYICDTGNDRVQAFDFGHSFCKHFGLGQLLKPVDIEIDSGGRIVVLDRGPKCIHVFSQSGEMLFSLIAFAVYHQVINPLFFTLSKDDEIFLSDYARNCVFVFSMDGALKGQIGEDGVFSEPRGLAFDNSGRLVVVSCNHTACLQFFDM